MRPSASLLKTPKSLLAKAWKPRAAESTKPTIPVGGRHPELFTSQIILSDGSSFRVKSTAPRGQVKITKDTRSHPLWNPHADRKIDDEGGYLSVFQKKFQGFDSTTTTFAFADDAARAKEQLGSGSMMSKKKPSTGKK